mgnify:CR=1 FL=1
MRLSKNLSLSEVIKSNTAIRLGIKNLPTTIHAENLKAIAEKVFQPLRNFYNSPIYVSSGYRGADLNKAIGGSRNSQHCKGEALDLDADVFGNVKNSELFYYIKNHLDFDQLIWEFGTDTEPSWVHVSYTKQRTNRNMILKAYKVNGKTHYKNIT